MELNPPKKPNLLHYDIEYDSTKPELTLKTFVSDIKGMLSRYEGNKNRIVEIEQELQDIYHYMEIAAYKKVPDGYKLYRKIAELRRERRSCKNEIDLLWPIYEYFHGTDILNKLSYIQGEVSKMKGAIDNRTYQVRSDVLDSWLNPDEPKTEEPADEDENVFETADLTIDDLEDVPENQITKSTTAKYKQVWKAANA